MSAGCSGTTNTEFDPFGYIYNVRVKPAAVGTPFTLQIYDPAFVQVGDDCNGNPSQTSGVPFVSNMSPFVPLDGTSDKVAVHAVCRENVFWETLESLKSAGASAILVLPVEKMLA